MAENQVLWPVLYFDVKKWFTGDVYDNNDLNI